MKVNIKCSECGEVTAVEITEEQYAMWQSGEQVQSIFTNKDAFFRELFVTGTCYECQSRIYHRPKPGESWGDVIAECEVCGCPIYPRDAGVCPMCGEVLSAPNEDEICCDTEDCKCKECGACADAAKASTEAVHGDHVCRCGKCKG